MRICGVDYQGSDLIPVVIENDGAAWRIIETNPTKLTIGDIFDTANVRLFAKEVMAFLTDHEIDIVVVKKRAKSGKFGGGAASFRMDGVVQLSTEKPVEFISPQAVVAVLKNAEEADGAEVFAYQKGAFRIALAYALRP